VKIYKTLCISILALFAGILIVINFILPDNLTSKNLAGNNGAIIITMNRMAADFQDKVKEENLDVEGAESAAKLLSESDGDLAGNVSLKMWFVPASKKANSLFQLSSSGEGAYVWSIYDSEDELLGLLFCECTYHSMTKLVMNIIVAVLLVVTVLAGWIIYKAYLLPMQQLEEYPEKLSKGLVRSLPETKYRNLGKFVWGINMLADTIENNKNSLRKAEAERQTLLTGVAHGVKTPIANIKLYSEAIETGLYQADGKVNEEDAKVAAKIKSNAENIEVLVKQLLDTASTGVYGYEPVIKPFYVKSVANKIESEFGNRFVVSRIPYEVICKNNLLVNSDETGVISILSQFIENAIKYGDGRGINIVMEKQEDSVFFMVRNKGKVLNESELGSVFKSFWRGSNSDNIPGSGMGMYMAKEMARQLGGEVYARALSSEEMEFALVLPV